MRILHTSDWHLGRIFHGIHLTDDQAYLLEQFVALVKEMKPDVILIAGDIFDRSVPPIEAINLLDDVVSQILIDYHVPIIMVAGNHDSPDRLGFGYRLMGKGGLNISGKLMLEQSPVVLEDTYGQVAFHTIPYIEPASAREILCDSSIHCHDGVMRTLIKNMQQKINKKSRHVLVTHAFVVGGEESESERPLSIGGSGVVNSTYFQEFDYVALGHLHRPQKIEGGKIRYSGSLMKYSFSEANHKKSVCMVDLDEAGEITTENIELTPRRDLRCVEGYLDEILREGQKDPNSQDYLMVTLKDVGALFDPIGKLRKIYPNVLHIERTQLLEEKKLIAPDRNFQKMNDLDLFSSFYYQVTQREIEPSHKEVFRHVLDNYYKAMREE